jgi:TfoX/Sxy family transcriptional regulator of competence genes
MTMPKPSQAARAAFAKLVPEDPAVTTRPMFGNLSGFVNGNMFCGLFGEDLFVRISEPDQAKVRAAGGRPFEPMPGRAMTGYVLLPAGWQKKPDSARQWIASALVFTKKLPAKAKKTSKSKVSTRPKASARPE